MLTPAVQAQTFHQAAVGVGPGCDHATIQSAVDAAASGPTHRTTLRITRSAAWTQQKIVVNGKNVTLRGGYADCLQTAPDGVLTRIDGTGGASGSVVEIKGTTDAVALVGLEITGGDAAAGGGVHVHEGPHGLVQLGELYVHHNRADRGGGVYVAQPGLVQLDSVRLEANTAVDMGGGLGCEDGRVQVFGRSAIRTNTAPAGGGLLATGGLTTCSMDFTSSLPFAIYDNHAVNGAGISAFRARVRLYTSDPQVPLGVLGNTASTGGGGIHVGALASVYLYNAVLASNAAPIGGAVKLDSTGILPEFPQLALFVASSRPPADLPDAVTACAQVETCNRISGNAALGSSGAGPGVAFHLRRRAEVYLEGTRVDDNQGSSLVHAQDDAGLFIRFQADGALLHDNTVDVLAQAAGANQRVRLLNTTIARNVIAGPVAFVVETQSAPEADLGFSMGHGIFWQPGRQLVPSAGIQPTRVRYNIANSLVGVNAGDTLYNRVTDPQFVAAAAGNFRLGAASLGLDTAPSAGGFTRDGAAREVDIAGLNNSDGTLWGGGPRDMGAYEAPADALLAIFMDGFE